MNDQAVVALRILLIVVGCGAGAGVWAMSYVRRLTLSFWEAMTRSSIGLYFFGSAFATLSSLLAWDPDVRVTILLVSGVGVCTGLVMTSIRGEERRLPHPIESVANTSTPAVKEIP